MFHTHSELHFRTNQTVKFFMLSLCVLLGNENTTKWEAAEMEGDWSNYHTTVSIFQLIK